MRSNEFVGCKFQPLAQRYIRGMELAGTLSSLRAMSLTKATAAELTMLRNASQVVAPGGRLVYATCSSEPEENEAVADAFLASPSGFRALPARAAVPALPEAVVDARGHLRTEPHVHGLEAFFGAVFERHGA